MQTIPQKYILNWYHTYLLHLRMDRTKATTSQHFYMPNIMDEVFARIIYFKNCQQKIYKATNMAIHLQINQRTSLGTYFW